MPDPFRPQATVDSASRIAFDIATLRSEIDEIERNWATTVVYTSDPTPANEMRNGTVWINQTSGRMYVSAAPGVWISADAQRIYNVGASQVCTTGTTYPGPATTIYVPPNGIVGIYSRAAGRAATVGAGTFAGTAMLREATDFSGGMNLMQWTDPTQFLDRTSVPANPNGTSVAYGGWIVYRATPGWRTYEMGLVSAGGGANVCFQDRRLWIATF